MQFLMQRDAPIRIVEFPETAVAALEQAGDIEACVARFIAWRKQAGLPRDTHATFNIIRQTPAGRLCDVCVATDGPIAPNDAGVIAKVIPGGRCAMLRYTGPEHALGDAVTRLYAEWLPASGETLRSAPLFFQRVQFPPFSITDIYLPIV
jgi:AraC family transcriptional regulator